MHQTDIRIPVITTFDMTYEGDEFLPECYKWMQYINFQQSTSGLDKEVQ